MHGRQDSEARCLTYWLEFKNDEEFYGNQFGGIGGGSALKFGIYQRQSDGAWIAGSALSSGCFRLTKQLGSRESSAMNFSPEPTCLATWIPRTYQTRPMVSFKPRWRNSPNLSGDGWAHKYWCLTNSDKVDNFHSPRHQRFHLFKLLQMPPDKTGILEASAPRFNWFGRFLAVARRFEVHVSTLMLVLLRRNGGFHRYWRVGTTEGAERREPMADDADDSFVSVGWPERVPDLSDLIGQEKTAAKNQIRDWLLPTYPSDPGIATRKAGGILNLAQGITERDLVLACDGQTVLGVGLIAGPYEYDPNLVVRTSAPSSGTCWTNGRCLSGKAY